VLCGLAWLLQMAQEQAAAQGTVASTILRRGHLRAELKAPVREQEADLLVLGEPARDDNAYPLKELESLAAEIEAETKARVDIL
jgi:hypothetical protein